MYNRPMAKGITLGMKQKWRFVWVLSLLCWVGCSAPLVPAPRLPKETRAELSDASVLQALRDDWQLLHQLRMPAGERAQVIERYNRNLLTLLRRVRVDALEALRKQEPYHLPFCEWKHDKMPPHLWLTDVYQDMLPAADVRTRDLEEHYTVPGLGVPLVGIIPAQNMGKLVGRQSYHFQSRGTVSTLTAVMEFPKGRKPLLRLISRQDTESTRIGRLEYQLAGDFSAPLEIYWNLTRVKDGRLLGLLRPQELRDVSGLTCIEDYDPEKIPVILCHGLMSSAGTFENLVNRLLSDSEIRQKYQFWYFNYPTGVSWVISAAHYRQSLALARATLDPKRRNANWDRMVVAGHSMGGLITHYSQCVEPWKLLEASRIDMTRWGSYLDKKYVTQPFPQPVLEPMRSQYFFEPVQAGMVIYMATPHRGAPLARYRLVTMLMQLIKLPQNIIKEAIDIATLQQNTVLFHPDNLTAWFTSISQLSPDSYSIRGLAPLQVRGVLTHSIIGDRGCRNSPYSSDGVVPYWSSHISWGSQTIVPASHSVQKDPQTAEDLKEVLKKYARR